jgi:uncharacterized protein YycO
MTAQVRFVTCADVISAGIRLAEYGFWASHAEVLMPDGKLLGAHADGGVKERDQGYDKATLLHDLFVPLTMPADQEAAFFAFLRSQLGKPYDFDAIAGIVAQRDWRALDSWFCSELVAAGLEHCGYLPPLAADVAKITPRDLLLILSGRLLIAAA